MRFDKGCRRPLTGAALAWTGRPAGNSKVASNDPNVRLLILLLLDMLEVTTR
jgi:hypothetical protein